MRLAGARKNLIEYGVQAGMSLKMKRVKIDEMTGFPLSFIVALAEGYEYKTDEDEIEKYLFKSEKKIVYLQIDEYRDECGLKVIPYCGTDYYNPTNNWMLAGQLFDKYNPRTSSDYNNEVLEVRIEMNGKTAYGKGDTYMVALCRAIAYYHFGEFAEVPSILVRHMENTVVKKYIIEEVDSELMITMEFLDGETDSMQKPSETTVDDFIKSWQIASKKWKKPLEIRI